MQTAQRVLELPIDPLTTLRHTQTIVMQEVRDIWYATTRLCTRWEVHARGHDRRQHGGVGVDVPDAKTLVVARCIVPQGLARHNQMGVGVVQELDVRDGRFELPPKRQFVVALGVIIEHRELVQAFEVRQTNGVFWLPHQADDVRRNVRVLAGQPHRKHMGDRQFPRRQHQPFELSRVCLVRHRVQPMYRMVVRPTQTPWQERRRIEADVVHVHLAVAELRVGGEAERFVDAFHHRQW